MSIKDIYYRNKFNLKDRREFYELFASYLDSNSSNADALETMEKIARKFKDYRAYIYRDVLNSMSEGLKLSVALAKWIPDNEYMLIEAGEKGAGIADSFREAVYLADAIGQIKKVVIGTMFMPFLMLFVLFIMLLGFRLGIANAFLDLLPLEEWTDNALISYKISDFAYRNWIFISFGTIALITFVFMTISTWKGMIRIKFFDKIPPYNIYKKLTESSFLITFSSLLRTNTPLKDSLVSIERSATPYLSFFINKMLEKLALGEEEGVALNVGLLKPSVAGNLEGMAKLGGFELALHNMGKRNVENSIQEVSIMMRTINSILTFSVLGVAIFIFFSLQELSVAITNSIS